jgi:galactokinase
VTGTRRASAPGRVNLIGDHTDYNGGVALPMAIDRTTEVELVEDDGAHITLASDAEVEPAVVDVDAALDATGLRSVTPRWARLVAALVALVRPAAGGRGTVHSRVPVGAGLASSAAFEVALALVLGADTDGTTLARLCQRAEETATGVPSGLMDQLTAIEAQAGHALLIDFADLSVRAVPVPADLDVIVVDSGQRRTLEHTAYAARRAECEAASFHLGPLGSLSEDALSGLTDVVLRRRARHVVTECERVRTAAEALGRGDGRTVGRLMTASHRSLSGDFDVSTPVLDELVDHLTARPGVLGARVTGAGFGGCVVALTEGGALDPGTLPTPAWSVRPSSGASIAPIGAD